MDYREYSEQDFCNLILDSVNNLSSNSDVMNICRNFIIKYPKGVFLNEYATLAFENYILDRLNEFRITEDMFHFNENKGKNTLWMKDEKRSTYNEHANFGVVTWDFINAFEDLVTFFIKENHIKDKFSGFFIVWNLLKKAAIDYFSEEFEAVNAGMMNDMELLSIEECYKRYQGNHHNGLVPYEDSLFIYYLIKHGKISSNFIVERRKFNKWREEQRKTEAFNVFADGLRQVKKEIPLLSDNDKLTINDVDLMTGEEFENFLVELFKRMGYSAWKTQTSNDQGVDIVAVKNNYKIGIQAKCYSGTVSNKSVQEIAAGIKHYNLDRAMVITNNYFSNSAVQLAVSNDVVLWDREILKEKIKEFF